VDGKTAPTATEAPFYWLSTNRDGEVTADGGAMSLMSRFFERVATQVM